MDNEKFFRSKIVGVGGYYRKNWNKGKKDS